MSNLLRCLYIEKGRRLNLLLAFYRYFGTTGFAELTSAVTTAWGSDQDLLNTNENFHLTGEYHMYAQGMTSLFNYADHGPLK